MSARVTCWAVLACVGIASAKLRPDPFESRAAVEEGLRVLAPMSEEELRGLVEDLGADAFAARQNAQRRLMRVPERLAPVLEDLRDKSEDPEVRKGLGQALAKIEPQDRTVAAKLARSVLVHAHRGLASELLAALPSAADRRMAEKVIAAARLSATDDERAEVIEALSADTPLVREGAVRVMAALDADPREALRGLLDDADGMVRLAAAEVFAAKADPACLGVLAGMLGGEDFYLRWRAAGMFRSLTGGEVDIDSLDPVAELDLDKWRAPAALAAWRAGAPIAPIALFEEGEDLSSWSFAHGGLADVVAIEPGDGLLRSLGTGHAVWGSPLRFQNYRVRVEWRFEWEDSVSNAGFWLAKFDGPPPGDFGEWGRTGALEVEIKEGSAGALFSAGGEAKIRQWHNERSADWNTLEVEERDGSLRVWVNGLLQNEKSGMDDALTTFGLRTDRTPIDWRNLVLEPLPGARVAPPLIKAKEENDEDQ